MFSYKPLCFADKYIPSPNEKMWSLLLTQAVFFFLRMTKYLLHVIRYCMANEKATFELYICILRSLKLAPLLI